MNTFSDTPKVVRTPPAWRAPFVVAFLGLLWWWLLPEQLGLLTRLAYTALFVLSLDLVVGVAGLPTLGHAALFGVGAYTAGIFATHVSADPLLGLIVAASMGCVTAGISGLFLLRFQGFTFLMLTVAFSQILLNLANKFRDWTGGDDGLSTYVMDGFSATSHLIWKAKSPQPTLSQCWYWGITWLAAWSTHRLVCLSEAYTRTELAWQRWVRRSFSDSWWSTRLQELSPEPPERYPLRPTASWRLTA